MTEKPSMTGLLNVARKMREQDDEFLPTMIYTPKEDKPGAIAVLAGEGTISEILIPVLSQLRAKFGSAEWIALTSDTWSKTYPKPEGDEPIVPPKHRQGQLGEEFNEGHPDVVEMMLVMVADGKTIETGTQRYRYTPADGWEWDEPKIITEDDQSGGAVPRVLTAFFMAQSLTEAFFRKERNDD